VERCADGAVTIGESVRLFVVWGDPPKWASLESTHLFFCSVLAETRKEPAEKTAV
jgi:hypothetical protein